MGYSGFWTGCVVRAFSVAVLIAGVAFAQTDTAQEAVDRGIALSQQGRFDEALEQFSAAIRENPQHAGAYTNRGIVYSQKRQYAKAYEDLTKAIELAPGLAAAYSNRGSVALNEGEFRQAIADYSQALKIRPDYADAFYNRGLAYENMGWHDHAIADYTMALRYNPEDAEAFYRRAMEFFFKKRFSRARDDVKKAQALGLSVEKDFLEELDAALAGEQTTQ